MNRLTEALAEICRTAPLREKWLVAPSRRVGHQWQQSVARSGQPVVQLHIKTFKSFALDLAAPQMARLGLRPAPARARTLLLQQTLHELAHEQFRYLKGTEIRGSFVEAAAATLQALRLAGTSPDRLRRAMLEAPGKEHDLATLLTDYLRRLQDAGLVDDAQVLRFAIERVQDEPQCLRQALLVVPGELLDLTPLQEDLLGCVPDANKVLLPVDPPREDTLPCDGRIEIGCSVGEVNEVQAVLSHCLAQGIAWDQVELLHTDAETYVPLIHETLHALQVFERVEGTAAAPVTFAEGIPCRYSRPGRALIEWARWIREEFSQARLVKMVRDGLLKRPGETGKSSARPLGTGAARRARLLRGVAVGFGRERYLPQIDGSIARLRERLESRAADHEEDDPAERGRQWLANDLKTLLEVRRLVASMLRATPSSGDSAGHVVRCARRFLRSMTRQVDRMDSFARERLCEELADIERWLPQAMPQATEKSGPVASLAPQPSVAEMLNWLEALPSQLRVLGSGPRPQCLHVDSVHRGGHSGREHTFVVGLDDSRFPPAGLQDPLLLDAERRRVSQRLRTAADARADAIVAWQRLLAGLRGQLHLRYCCRGLTEDREMFPSPLLLALFRRLTDRPQADQQEFTQWLDHVESFAPRTEAECLDLTRWWLWRLTQPALPLDLEKWIGVQYPHLGRGLRAQDERGRSRLNPYNGLVTHAGAALDPTARDGPVISAHGLELAGRCPRAFFFRYGLDITQPEETDVDPLVWLDPLTRGLLLHELFEQFMRRVIEAGRTPNYARDVALLERLLGEKLAAYRRQYPAPSESIYQREARRIERTARTFLRAEERFCRENRSRPVYLETALGMEPSHDPTPLDSPDPIVVRLPGGRKLRARGRIDRIDQLDDAMATFAVWDYKTGGAGRYETPRGIGEGRVVQPSLYVSIVEHRLRAVLDRQAEVLFFGFFFPDQKAAGQRIQYRRDQLDEGLKILEPLCRLIAAGAFVATHDATDCRWCDYRPICGDVEAAARTTAQMLAGSDDRPLDPMRQLRGIGKPA